jgi:hypothetical protein
VTAEALAAVTESHTGINALHGAGRFDALASKGWEWLRTFLACSGSMHEWFGVP